MFEQSPLYAATSALVRTGFAEDDSLFTPGRAVWTVDVVDDLHRRFVESSRLARESFPELVERTLRGAPGESVQLLGELLFLHLLTPTSMGASAKRRLLARVLAIATDPVTLPREWATALEGGFANPGRAYAAYRDRQIGWLIRLVQAWKRLPAHRREEASRDPWAFRAVADSIPILTAYSQRNALLHLAFPGTFEAIVSRTHKRQIVDAFADEHPARHGDVDRDLLALRRHLETVHGRGVDFYSPALAARWRPAKEPPRAPATSAAAEDLTEPPAPTQALAAKLFLDQRWLAETVDLLREKKQLVLYGPPGTGKTYLAQEIAEFLAASSGGTHRLVQFHPSYAYEDFFEGIRPRLEADTGAVAFVLEPGPLKLLAQEAAAHPDATHVLVIDEINRANLAAVFGELYFLLEYRDRGIRLQYSPSEEFRLPPNLYFIGTMNTADRSIAHVDAAMRRRFAWQGLFPGETPMDQMLRGWLAAHGVPLDRADLLDELNARLGDRDASVGPSYLMSRTAATEVGLARVWKHHILPLLHDHHSGDGVEVERRYGIAALRAKTSRPSGGSGGSSPVEETGERPA